MNECRADFETRSDVDLKTCGAPRYFASKHFRPLILCFSIDNGPILTWLFGQSCPAVLREHVESGGTIRAFNANFERKCFDWLADHQSWPRPKLEQYRCTAAEAAAMGLPRKLANAAQALGLSEQKDKEGDSLIRFFSVPRKPRKGENAPNDAPLWNEPKDHPEKFQRFAQYCAQDVRTEGALARRTIRLSDYEQAVWVLDARINDRGVRIDRESCEAAINLVGHAKARLDAEMKVLTGGAVPACSNVAKLVEWVGAQGVEMDGAAKDKVLELLDCDDLPQHVRRALELRQEAAKTSTAKLQAFMRRASDDGRVRSAFLYHAASTGRWSSIGANMANLPRPRFVFQKAFEDGVLDQQHLFETFRAQDPDALALHYGPELGRPLHLVSDSIRGFLWAAPGHDYIAADYSGIEGAVIAWLSGENWKLKALTEIIADPSLPDMYRRTAASIMNTTTEIVSKRHPLRQSVGKVSELALGYQGGVSAFVQMARGYNVNLHSLYAPVWGAADEETRHRAVKRYENCLKARDKVMTNVLSREAWLACEIIKIGWRRQNPAIVESWETLSDAMRNACRHPGQKFDACKVTYLVANNFLWCRLPSGRCLAYGAPKLKDQVWAKIQNDDGTWPDQAETMDRDKAEFLAVKGRAKIEGQTKPAVTALGVNSTTQKYERFALYGGLAAENNTQAVARDVFVHGMLNAEAAGYATVAHTYDEVLAEVPHSFGSLEEFERLLIDLPTWAQGLPLTAHGWRGKRYRKA